MIVVVADETELEGAEEVVAAAIREWAASEVGGVAIFRCHVPESRGGSVEVDALVCTPQGATVVEVKGFTARQDGVLATPPNGPWTVDGAEAALYHAVRVPNPFVQVRRQVFAAKNLLQQSGIFGWVNAVVALVPQPGAQITLEEARIADGYRAVLVERDDSSSLRDYFHAETGRTVRLNVNDVRRVFAALNLSHLLPSRVALADQGFPARLEPSTSTRAAPAAAGLGQAEEGETAPGRGASRVGTRVAQASTPGFLAAIDRLTHRSRPSADTEESGPAAPESADQAPSTVSATSDGTAAHSEESNGAVAPLARLVSMAATDDDSQTASTPRTEVSAELPEDTPGEPEQAAKSAASPEADLAEHAADAASAPDTEPVRAAPSAPGSGTETAPPDDNGHAVENAEEQHPAAAEPTRAPAHETGAAEPTTDDIVAPDPENPVAPAASLTVGTLPERTDATAEEPTDDEVVTEVHGPDGSTDQPDAGVEVSGTAEHGSAPSPAETDDEVVAEVHGPDGSTDQPDTGVEASGSAEGRSAPSPDETATAPAEPDESVIGTDVTAATPASGEDAGAAVSLVKSTDDRSTESPLASPSAAASSFAAPGDDSDAEVPHEVEPTMADDDDWPEDEDPDDPAYAAPGYAVAAGTAGAAATAWSASSGSPDSAHHGSAERFDDTEHWSDWVDQDRTPARPAATNRSREQLSSRSGGPSLLERWRNTPVRERRPRERRRLRIGPGIGLLLFIALFGAGFFAITAVQASRFEMADYDRMCDDRKPFPNAAEYQRDGARPTYLSGDLATMVATNSSPAWHPTDPATVQLIACMRQTSLGDLVQTCQLPAAPGSPIGRTVNLFRATYEITVYELRTGREAGRAIMVGERYSADPANTDPDRCRAVADAPDVLGRRLGQPSTAQVTGFLAPLVHADR
ncbi:MULTISPECIES: NERD domain-containing protein [unclassified Nocardia]|uniref:NERD domain-containing protein n=1 Tax=unclassified Nocardia TaxID=2637762 RepID=UPI0033B6E4B8